jgi:predicted DNA-binding transcriptional regulator YafY
VQERRKVFVNYRDLAEKTSERTLRPLGCFYWGKVWTLAAWCEQRTDFRTFRVDRITYVRSLEERFRDEPGRTLADMARLNEARAREQGWAA